MSRIAEQKPVTDRDLPRREHDSVRVDGDMTAPALIEWRPHASLRQGGEPPDQARDAM